VLRSARWKKKFRSKVVLKSWKKVAREGKLVVERVHVEKKRLSLSPHFFGDFA